MLLSIMEDIRFLSENREKFSSEEYKKILEDRNKFFNELPSDNNILTVRISSFVERINNIYRKDL